LKREIFIEHPMHERYIVPNPKSLVVRTLCPDGVVKPPFIAQLKHDEILSRGLLQCLKTGCIESFVNEAVLKKIEPTGFALKERQKLPDLIVDMKSGKRMAVELELTQKSTTRYSELFSAYRSRKDIEGIVFVVDGRPCLDAIVKASKKAIFQTAPIGFVDLEDWSSNAPKATVAFEQFKTAISEL
jgi:hypothetical protein